MKITTTSDPEALAGKIVADMHQHNCADALALAENISRMDIRSALKVLALMVGQVALIEAERQGITEQWAAMINENLATLEAEKATMQ